jgi:hypothetical protein
MFGLFNPVEGIHVYEVDAAPLAFNVTLSPIDIDVFGLALTTILMDGETFTPIIVVELHEPNVPTKVKVIFEEAGIFIPDVV